MFEFIQTIGERILSDGGLSAFILFFALVASNYYHIRTQKVMHHQNRTDLLAAWGSVWKISESTNKTLGEINGTLLVVRDRLERR